MAKSEILHPRQLKLSLALEVKFNFKISFCLPFEDNSKVSGLYLHSYLTFYIFNISFAIKKKRTNFGAKN